MCYCNRRIIRGMVTAVDSMVANLTLALQAKGMWDNTIFILLGDNGAPNNNAGWNTVFKGMKFSHWEGRYGLLISVAPCPSAHVYQGLITLRHT
eukprot:m.135458 g.135458  ORF g.135458 m.135458 type:complete len:94 (-) comp11417_c0_seq1:1382-1663(-)